LRQAEHRVGRATTVRDPPAHAPRAATLPLRLRAL
jgi:hypothetical protein